MTLTVLGVLKLGDWGWIQPKSGAPVLLGTSPVLWLIIGGLLVLYFFLQWTETLENDGREPLIRPSMFRNRQLDGGLVMFFFQYLVQNSAFFVIPLFLSVVLELSAVDTGVRLLPLSIALLLSAALHPTHLAESLTAPRRAVWYCRNAPGIPLFCCGPRPHRGSRNRDYPSVAPGAGIGALHHSWEQSQCRLFLMSKALRSEACRIR